MGIPKAVVGTLGRSQSAVCVHIPFWTLVKLGLAGLCVAVVPAGPIPVT